jgi:predicted DNA-binding transcriptional regulator AlpA
MSSDRLEPLAVPTTEAARLCGLTVPMWRKLDRSGRCPAPLKVGRRLLWRVRDLEEWLEAGCPARSEYQARRWRRDRSDALNELKAISRAAAAGEGA